MATVFQESTQTGKLRARANTTFKCAKWQTGNKTFWAKTRAPFQRTPKSLSMYGYSKGSRLIINSCQTMSDYKAKSNFRN